MREILFKGKRVDNGEWVEGYYSKCAEHGDNGCAENRYQETHTILHYISDIEGNSYLVTPETVSQYTGLTDNNGKMIFEGDIAICFEYECCGKIEYDENYGSFYFLVALEDGRFEEEHLYDYVDELTILGNIFDDPEFFESEGTE